MTHLRHLQKKHLHSGRKSFILHARYHEIHLIHMYEEKAVCFYIDMHCVIHIYTVFLPILFRLAKYPSSILCFALSFQFLGIE